MVRAALYARVSTDDKGQNPENQLMPLRDYCAKKDYSIVKEYSEFVSGSGKKERPEFDSLMRDAAKHSFDVVLVWAVDRFSRAGTLKTLLLVKRLADAGVAFESLQEPFLNTTRKGDDEGTGDLLLQISAWIAERESKRISKRVKAGIELRRSEGKAIGKANMLSVKERERFEGELARLYSEGLSFGAIAARGVEYQTVRRKQRKASVGFIHKTITKMIRAGKLQKR